MGMDRRLTFEISKELYAQLPLRDGCIRQEDVTGVAFAVATRLSRTFRIEWAPEWGDEEEGDDGQGMTSRRHGWGTSGAAAGFPTKRPWSRAMVGSGRRCASTTAACEPILSMRGAFPLRISCPDCADSANQ